MSHFRFVLPTVVAMSTIVGAAHADTIKVGGNVINETWTPAGSPYIVQGDLTVPNGAFLTIQAGTVVRFASTDAQHSGRDISHTELTVRGVLSVNGSEAKPVQFVGATPSSGSWYGVVLDTAAVSVTLSNLQIVNPNIGIQHLGAATAVTAHNVSITNADSNGVRISAGSPTYDGLTVIGPGGGVYGVSIESGGSATLINCLLRGLGGGVRFAPGAGNVTVDHCTIDGNKGSGVAYTGTTTTASVAIINSIISNNSGYAIFNNWSDTSISISFSDVWGNANGNYFGPAAVGPGVISANPLYVSAIDRSLQSSSVCIDAGTPTSAARDIVGVSRPLDGDGINGAAVDMGAYEFVRIPGVTSPNDTRVADGDAEAPDDELSDDASSGGCSAGGAPGTLAGGGLIGVALALSRIRRRRR